MNDLIIFKEGAAFTSTMKIAEGVGNQHKNVLELARKYIDDLKEFGGVAFETLPFETAGGKQDSEVALLNEHQSTLLLTYMRNTKVVRKFKIKLVKAFFELAGKSQSQPQPLIPQTLPEALRLAADLADKNSEQAKLIEHQAPSVEAFGRIAKAEGSLCVRDAAKNLQIRPKDLTSWLSESKWIYKRFGNALWIGYQDKIQAGYIEHKITIVLKPDETEKTITQARITPKGLAKISMIFNQEAA